MAAADYHLCDLCGAKTFYDADIDGAVVGDEWRYGYAKGGEDYPAFPGYRAWALCNKCEQTHEIIIRPKADLDRERGL